MEKVLTDEQLISLLDVLEEGDKSFTQASYRDVIMTAHTDMLFELGIRDVAAMEAGWKAFGGLQTKFHGKILSIYGKFQAGTLSTAAATTQFNNMLKVYGKDAFMAGTEMVGNSYYKEVGMTAKDKAFISKYARTETRHWRKFLNDVKDPKHLPANKIPRDKSGRLLKGYRRQVHPYRQRVGYYADSLRGMGFNGMVAGAGTLLNIFWVLDKLTGRRTDHCNDCVRIAAGNPYSWQTLPTTPKAGDTECKYRCYCGLEFQQRKGRGKEFDMPGSGSVQGLQAPNRWARVFDRFGRPISGAPLQDVEDIYQRMYKARQMIEITKAQEKLGWIRARQQLNNVLINQYPQYRKIPLVSVKDLTKAVTAARPARGDLLKNLANISSGTEVTFLRGNYFANGKLFLERGQWVFKDATGVRLAANLETDIVFTLVKAKSDQFFMKEFAAAIKAGKSPLAALGEVFKTELQGDLWETVFYKWTELGGSQAERGIIKRFAEEVFGVTNYRKIMTIGAARDLLFEKVAFFYEYKGTKEALAKVFKEVLRKVKACAHAHLKTKYPKGYVTLYRGVSREEFRRVHKLIKGHRAMDIEALSGFTEDLGTAHSFAHSYDGYIVKCEVSIENILSSPDFKFSRFAGEQEWLILGKNGLTKLVDIVDFGYHSEVPGGAVKWGELHPLDVGAR